MKDEVKVSQADRNAAVRLLEQGGQDWQAKEIRLGQGDHFPIVQSLARHRHQAERETLARMEWRPIETAPYDTPVEVKVGSMTFLARLLADASMSSLDETCDQWQAENDGEHPPCWSGGACWASNENEDMSLQPTAWRYPPAPEAGQ